MKGKKKGLIILLICILVLSGIYHGYTHYMVSRFYKYIDVGDTDGAIECIEKMPNVNLLDKCYPFYVIEGICLQYAASEGYPLHYAIWKKADVSIIDAFVRKGADPNKKDVSVSDSTLHCLCCSPQKGMYQKVKLLVEHGADVENETGLLFTSMACFRNADEKSKEALSDTVIYLWEYGADERQHVDTKYENTVLHTAAEYMDIKYLSSLYNNEKRPMTSLLNRQDANGETPLFCAVRAGQFDNCAFLIQEGADVTIQNNDGKTVYDIAVELGYEENVDGLKE